MYGVNIFVASDLLLMAEDMLDVSFRIQGECISGITMDACRSIVYTNLCVTMRRLCVHVCMQMCACVLNTDDAAVNTKLITFLACEYASVII